MNRQNFVANLNGNQERANAVSLCSGRRLTVWMTLVVVLVACGIAFAGVTASISGTVKDSTGAVLVGASVTATNTATGVAQTVVSNGDGAYNFPALPPGKYVLEVRQQGFKAFKDTDIELNVNEVRTIDAVLPVGQVAEAVTVSADALHAETASTQLGEVIQDKEMTSVPLNGRSYTDLLALQPGVGNTNSSIGGGSSTSNLFQSGGFQLPQVSGDQNPGNLSVNGMRESANGYLLNGVSVQEYGYSGTAVVPNLDSLAEFRIITNNFDAEYGNFSGGQINVVTKAGANQIHGNVFEFWRNTSLDAANFFDQGKRGPWHQNEFGGTLGGPIKRNKVFFFGDYQENRRIVGVSTGSIAVPTSAERGGDFSALTNPFVGKTVQGSAWADVLSQREFGTTGMIHAGEAYSGCSDPTVCVFPNGKVPGKLVSQIATNVLQAGAIPAGDGNGTFSTSAFAQNLTDRKGSGRVDANLGGIGTLFGYYYIDQFSLNNPYPVATVPGFNATTKGRTQVVNIGDSKPLGSNAVNEARIGYLRVHDFLNSPSGGTNTKLAQLGFSTDTVAGGILPLDPATEGLPEMDFQSFSIGVPSRILGLVENTYQASDNYSRLIGTHSLMFGGSFHYTQLAEQLHNIENGYFFFNTASETGVDFADFLLGAPGTFQQGQTPAANTRSYYLGAFAQDSWRARSNLTVNYGVRWDVISPWWEQHNEIETLKLGLQSVKFPNSPRGWVFPGDPGIPKTIAPVRWGNFAPRLGIAYSPNAAGGFLGKLFGGPDQTSIRLAYGMYYSAYEGAYDFSVIGDAPYGAFYSSTSAPSFDKPYQTRATGAVVGTPFPANFNPASNIPASVFGTIGTSPAFNPSNQVPYAEQYELSLQRQLSRTDLVTLSYVGTQGHHLLVTQEANPVIHSLCVADPACVPNGEPSGDRGPFSSHSPSDIANGLNQFASEGYFSAIGNSAYHSLQIDYRHRSGPLQLLLGYTYSKSLDDGSGFGEQVNPFDPRLSRGLSAFDLRHNFVVSYSYEIPLRNLGGPKQLVDGWQVSGITTFSSGIPVYVFENDDNSLLGTTFAGPLPLGVDTPDFAGGTVQTYNARNLITPACATQPANYYFNRCQFTQEPLGSLGSSRRRFFSGPGINNFNVALAKNTRFGERYNLEFRAEFFNIFNHTQFANVQGNFNASNFGQATTARDPRIGQLALKFAF
jgi:hypothetical protein